MSTRRLSLLVVALIVAVANIWYWSRLLTEPGVLAHSDLYEYFLPVFLAPFSTWSATEFGGLPTIADPQNTTWYPVHAFFRWIGSWSGYVIAGYVIAGLGAAAYAWQITRSRVAALMAGIAWPWSEALSELYPHLSMLHGFAWLPWCLFGLERIAEHRSSVWIGATAVFVACLGLSGHPQVSVYGVYLIVGYAATQWVAAGRPRDVLLRIAAAFAIGGALAAIQVIPTIDTSTWVAREQVGFSQFADSFAKKPPELMAGLIPQFCHERRETPMYAGIVTLWLAGIAIASQCRQWRVRFWVVVAVVGLLLGLGSLTPLARVAYELPLYDRFRIVARHLSLYVFAIIALATLGVGALRQAKVTRRTAVLTAGSLTAASFVALYFISQSPVLFDFACDGHGFGRFFPTLLTDVRLQGGIAVASTLVLLFGVVRKAARVALAAVPLLLAFDLLNAQSEPVDLRGFQPPGIIQAGALGPSVHASTLRDELLPAHQRLLPIEGSSHDPIAPGVFARVWNTPSLGGYNPLLPRRLMDLTDMSAAGDIRGRVLLDEDRSLDVLAVRYIVVRASELAPREPLAADTPLSSLPDFDVVIGPADCGPRGPMRLSIDPPPMEVTGLVMMGVLRCGDNVTGDAVVGRVTVVDGTRETVVPIRTGAAVASDAGAVLRVPLPGADQAADGAAGERVDFAPTVARRLIIDTEAMNAAVAVNRLAFVLPNGRLMPVTLPTAALNGGRWREHRRFATARDTDRGHDAPGPAEEDFVVFENVRARPRAWFMGHASKKSDIETSVAIRSGRTREGQAFDVAAEAFVEPGSGVNLTGGQGRITSLAMNPGSFRISVDADGPGLVAVSELHHPGWKAWVDNVEAPVLRVDYAVMGVVVPGGQHRVRLAFQPGSLRLGAGISGVGAVAALVCLLAPLRRRRTAGLPGEAPWS